MNQSNIWIHFTLAGVLIVFAAVVGQIDRWRVSMRDTKATHRSLSESRQTQRLEAPEILVRFKSGTSLESIRSIAAENNDSLSDEYEFVPDLVVIDDLDNTEADAVAAEYAAMAEVEYAEPNVQIWLDDPIVKEMEVSSRTNAPVGAPNDPLFGDQWALNNSGGRRP